MRGFKGKNSSAGFGARLAHESFKAEDFFAFTRAKARR
jgi:hypothetical protein